MTEQIWVKNSGQFNDQKDFREPKGILKSALNFLVQ